MVTAIEEVTNRNSWFVVIKNDDRVEELSRMISEALRQAKEENKLIKVRVQMVDIEDTF